MKRLQRQAGRSDSWFSWDLQRAEVLNAWLTFAFELDPNGLYSPLAHEELPHQFALLASADVQQALTFARTYGRLGWLELKVDDSKHNPWRRGAEQRHSRLYRECGTDAHFAEPLLWIVNSLARSSMVPSSGSRSSTERSDQAEPLSRAGSRVPGAIRQSCDHRRYAPTRAQRPRSVRRGGWTRRAPPGQSHRGSQAHQVQRDGQSAIYMERDVVTRMHLHNHRGLIDRQNAGAM